MIIDRFCDFLNTWVGIIVFVIGTAFLQLLAMFGVVLAFSFILAVEIFDRVTDM